MIIVGKYIGHVLENKKISHYKILTEQGVKLFKPEKIEELMKKEKLYIVNMEFNCETRKFVTFKLHDTFPSLVVTSSDNKIFSLVKPKAIANFMQSYGYEYYFKTRNVETQGDVRHNAIKYLGVYPVSIDEDFADDIVTSVDYDKRKNYKLHVIKRDSIEEISLKPRELTKVADYSIVRTWDAEFGGEITILTYKYNSINISFKFDEDDKIKEMEITPKQTFGNIKKYLES